MEQNLTLYGRDRVRLLQGAVWSKSGQVALDNTFGDKREWAVAVREGNGVRAYSMDEILSGASSQYIDLLKIDIEGSEKELFSGDTSWLAHIRNLCIELHGASCERRSAPALRPTNGTSRSAVNTSSVVIFRCADE